MQLGSRHFYSNGVALVRIYVLVGKAKYCIIGPSPAYDTGESYSLWPELHDSFLDAIASLGSMLGSQSLINVIEILSNLGHIFRVCSEYVQSMFRMCSECAQSVLRVCSECVQSVFRVCSECVQSVLRVY